MINAVNFNLNKSNLKTKKEPFVNYSINSNSMSENKNFSRPSSGLLQAYYLNRSGNLSFEGLNVLSISQKFRPMESALIKETEHFVDIGDNARFIGQGLFSKAYEFFDLPNIIIKQSMGVDNFADEATYMQKLPETIKGSQEFVARLFDDDKGQYFILSTKVNGEAPHPQLNPWTEEHLKNLFDGLFEMDKRGFYHGDLNNGNIKLERDGKVNFLDYQWANETNISAFFENKEKVILPSFITVQNAQMFEMAEIPYYLKLIDNPNEGKNFLRNYLKAKSKYHEKRVAFMEDITSLWPYPSEQPHIDKAIKFEKDQAYVLNYSPEDIVQIEAYKIQFLSAFREAYKHIDPHVPNKNIIPAGSAYLTALNEVQAFRSEICKHLEIVCRGSHTEDYLKVQSEFGDYWFNNLREWSKGAFGFPYRHTANKLESYEHLHNFDNPKVDVEDFGGITDILRLIDTDYTHLCPRFVFFKNAAVKDKVTALTSIVNENRYAHEGEDIQKLAEKHRAFMRAVEKFEKSYESDNGLAVINTSLLATLRARELETEARNAICYRTLSGNSKAFAEKCTDQGCSATNGFSNLAKMVFDNILNYIS